MKINKQLVQEVANGKYSDYDSHGEMQRSAQRILDERLVSKFSTFCFRVFGGEMPDNIMDVYDAFVDFAIHGAEIIVKVPKEIHPTGKWQVFGMTPKEALKKLFMETRENEELMCGLYRKEFYINGMKGRFIFHPTFFHYCFAKGRINESQLLEACRVA